MVRCILSQRMEWLSCVVIALIRAVRGIPFYLSFDHPCITRFLSWVVNTSHRSWCYSSSVVEFLLLRLFRTYVCHVHVFEFLLERCLWEGLFWREKRRRRPMRKMGGAGSSIEHERDVMVRSKDWRLWCSERRWRRRLQVVERPCVYI